MVQQLQFFRDVKRWFRRRIVPLFVPPKPYVSVRTDDLPDRLEEGKVYLVGEGEHLWSAALRCPGGCGQVLEMNLVPDTRPLWFVTENAQGIVSMEPSIWRKRDCGCHFRLIKGRVIWY